MKKPVSSTASASTLEQAALAHFSAGRYKEAADLYKELLKRWDDAFYRQQLAQCYLHRALAMSAKGMPKEAIVLWENYAESSTPPLVAIDSYILWQLASKNPQKALAKLQSLTARDLEEHYPELAAWLGFLMVSAYLDLEAHLPLDSALLTHWPWVKDALDAYRNQQSEAAEQALKMLPFRSAFRDLRSLLKLLISGRISLEQAQAAISKIPMRSPYRPLADAVLAYSQHGVKFVETIVSLDPNHRRIVARAKGLSNKQIELLEALSKWHGGQSDKARFNLAIQYRALFGDELARAYCQQLLGTYTAGRKDYLKHFAAQDGFEQQRIQALLCEQGQDSQDAWFYWRRCIDALKNQMPESAKKIALILRHMANDASPGAANGLLIESLDYDQDDREVYLKILDYYDQRNPDPAKYQVWLDNSLKRFPADIDLLVHAARAASNRKAFKKAAGYAQSLLKIDPVNTLAKQLLFASHLAHARRLIKIEKFHLVAKELQAAEQLMIDKGLRRQVDLMRGFLVYAAEDKTQGLQLISQALQNLNADPVNAQFQAMIEANLMDMPVAALGKTMPPFKDHLLSAQQLARLIELIKQYDEQISDPKLLFKALDKVKLPVKKSLQQQNYSEDLLLDWCQILEKIGHFELLKHCAKQARAKWQKPIWTYYQIYSESQGDPERLGYMGLFTLQNALETARVNNDPKAVLIISRFIQRAVGQQQPFAAELDDDYYDDGEQGVVDMDVFDQLFSHVPDSIIIKVEQKVQAIMMQTDPERFMAETIRKRGQKIDSKKLATLFMDPNFFMAVAMFEAAEQLRIDIGLRFEDIVHYFENDTPQLSLPFF